ncbi:MAG: hypothetical protein KTR25_18830 [Myxococcales bacterium]|nr:hypothetical protein [Myxococcales bacterium]
MNRPFLPAHRRLVFLLAACVAISSSPSIGRTETPAKSQYTPPPPVSGRHLVEPESITLADVLSRTELVHRHLRVIRMYTGRPVPDSTFLQVMGAHPREVFIQTYGLIHRAQRLGFEYMGLPIAPRPRHTPIITPARNLELLNQALTIILRLRHDLGIKEPVSEPLAGPNTTASDVFNAIVSATHELDAILNTPLNDSEVYQIITLALHIASSIVSKTNHKFRPATPPFVPNQTPGDVYVELLECFTEIERIAEEHSLNMLRFSIADELVPKATTNHVLELSVLIVSELLYLHESLLGIKANIRSYYSGRKFPSHSVQRAQLLKATLINITSKGHK